MQEKGLCDRPHDDALCKKGYADNKYFKERVDRYGEIAKANSNKAPTKEQLQDAGMLPKFGGKGAGGRGGGGIIPGFFSWCWVYRPGRG